MGRTNDDDDFLDDDDDGQPVRGRPTQRPVRADSIDDDDDDVSGLGRTWGLRPGKWGQLGDWDKVDILYG